MTSTNTLLKVNNLSKIYYKSDHETEAVRDITFDLNEGDFIGIFNSDSYIPSLNPIDYSWLSIRNRIQKFIDDHSNEIRTSGDFKKKYPGLSRKVLRLEYNIKDEELRKMILILLGQDEN